MTAPQSLLLARAHEVAQVYADRVTFYLLSPRSKSLSKDQRVMLVDRLLNVTSSLGRHSLAVVGQLDLGLPAHLTELFDRLDALGTLSEKLGGPVAGDVLESFRHALLGTSTA